MTEGLIDSEKQLTCMQKLSMGFEIFQKYVHADEVYYSDEAIFVGRGVNPSRLTSQERETLEKLGWHWDQEDEFWHHF